MDEKKNRIVVDTFENGISYYLIYVEKMNIICYEPMNHKYIQMGKVIGDAFSCGKEL